MSIKSIIEQALGLDKIKEEIIAEINQSKEELEKIKQETQQEIDKKNEVTMTPKERATKNGEPWVAVLDTHVSPKDARNGYFELDWNDYFVEFLIANGFGYENDPPEEVVDRWFRTLATSMLTEEGVDINSHMTGGFINLKKISDDHIEAS